jgi:hypothetical protein
MKTPRLIHLVVATLLLAPGVLLVAAAQGQEAQELGNYNGTVSGTALHVQAGSAAFPNFATGAIDNRYPLAAARLDSSPFANALSSPLDTGPLGQTVAASGQQNQPQYADVRCPPQCDDKPVVVGSAPGPFASSQTADHKALAEAKAGGVSPSGGAPAPKLDPARATALRTALLAWRAQFLTVDDALRYPMPAADTPDGVSGDTARSEAHLDGSTLLLDGTSSVGELVLGGGALVLRDVNVKVSVTNDGTPKKTVAINIGSALVGGTPVTIGAGGVSVNGQAVPGIAEAAAQANAALNQTLGQAGIEVRSLGPSEQLTDHQLTLDAVGVLIRLAPAAPAPGVPANFTALAVGEVFTDSLAVPGEAGGGLDDGLPDVSAGTDSLTSPSTDTGTTGGSSDLSSASGRHRIDGHRLRQRHERQRVVRFGLVRNDLRLLRRGVRHQRLIDVQPVRPGGRTGGGPPARRPREADEAPVALPPVAVTRDRHGGQPVPVAKGGGMSTVTRVHCEFDDWDFAPQFTDGVCPLCGWQPEGFEADPPLSQRIDWFMIMLVVVVLASLLMGILVLRAYTQA